MKQKLLALFLVVVMVASTLTAIAATTATPVSAATATKTTLSVSKTKPVVGERVTFTVTLKAGTKPLSKPVKIWYTFNRVRYALGTHTTKNGVYKFGAAFVKSGKFVFHAEFAATSTYRASAGAVAVNVGTIPSTTTITASSLMPLPNQKVTFTVTLKAGSTPLSRPVKIWYTYEDIYADSPNRVRHELGTHNTVKGVYTFAAAYDAEGRYVFHAEFAGDSRYGASAGTVTVNVLSD